MNDNSLFYFPKFFTTKAILLYLFLILVSSVAFYQFSMPIMWIVFGIIEVILFFYFGNYFTRIWSDTPESKFKKNIFVTSALINVTYVVFSFYFYDVMTGEPFEFNYADSRAYHIEAVWLLGLFNGGNVDYYFNVYLEGFSDSGFPIFLAMVYYVFGATIIVPRIINALLLSGICLLIFNITKRTFDLRTAKMAAIFTMIVPNLIYYTGLHLKEITMVFFLIAFLERADYLIRERKNFLGNLILVLLLGFSLFFFRTVLALSAWFAVASLLLMSDIRTVSINQKILTSFWLIAGAFLFLNETIIYEINQLIVQSDAHIEQQMFKFVIREGGNEFAKYGSRTLFLPVMLIAPFPTLVDVGQFNAMMVNGSIFTRNVYSFFIIISFWVIIKQKLYRKYVLIISFVLSYLFILSSSGFALSERFHIPALPFLMILLAFGITNVNEKNIKYYLPYLVLVFLLVLAWNWFKLAGRGLI